MIYKHIIGAMFVYGFLMSSPVWDTLSPTSKVMIAVVWPIALGTIVYEELNKDD